MGAETYAGGCLCGQVRYLASGEATNLCICYCESCRRASGASMVPWGTFLRANFHITHGELTEYPSSAHVLRGFCRRCGTTLTYRNDSRPAEIDATLASLDEPARLTPQMHVWVGDKLPWISIDDDRPQFMAGTGDAT